jgi:hypothetical protein
MRRVVMAFAVLIGVGCSSVAAAAKGRVSFRVLDKGAYAADANASRADTHPLVRVASTETAYRDIWRALIGDSPPPRVDFGKETALFLFLGQRPTGGYGVEVKTATVKGDTVSVAVAPVTPSTKHGRFPIVTMAISSPYAVIAVSGRGVANAVWLDPAGEVVARSTTEKK